MPVHPWFSTVFPRFLGLCQVGLLLSHYKRLVVAGSDIRRLNTVSLGLIYSPLLPLPARSPQKAEV